MVVRRGRSARGLPGPGSMYKSKSFGGRAYNPYGRHKTKAKAESEAKKLRRWPSVDGTRVSKAGASDYRVYIHQKPLR